MKPAVLLAAVGLALSAPAMAQKSQKPTPPPADPAPGGTPHTRIRIHGEVAIGDRAPDFELDGSGGRPVRLVSLRGDWVLLLFDSRKEQVASMRPVSDDLRALGVRPVGICDEKAYHLESFAKRDSFPYLLLADPTGEISALYGLYDHELSTTGPGFLLLDREGIVRMALLGQRFPPDNVLQLIRYAISGF